MAPNHRPPGPRDDSAPPRAGPPAEAPCEERPAANAQASGPPERETAEALARRLEESDRLLQDTERRLREAQDVLGARNRIAQIFLSVPDEQMYHEVLQVVLELAESDLGAFGYLDDRGDSIVPTMTRQAWDRCRVPDKQIVFPRQGWGDTSWPRAIREKRTICSNEPSAKLPAGHVPILRHVAVPLVHQGRVVGIIMVANRKTDYRERDIALLETLGRDMAPVLDARLQRERQEAARRETEAALREKTEEVDRFFSGALDLLCIADTDGYFVRLNREWERTLGYPIRELEGRRFLDLVHPEDLAATVEAVSTLGKGREILNFVNRYRCRDGSYRWIEWRSIPAGKRIYAAARDVTERRRAEAERERLLRAIEQAGEAIVITDPDGTIRYVNPAFEAVTGYGPEEAVGQNPRILKSGVQDDAFYRALWETVSSGRTWKGRFVNRRKDGRLFTEQATISPVRDAAGRIEHYVAVKRDITEALDMEARFQQAQKMESVGRLAGGVAHDFNNMLTVILGHAELARNRPECPGTLHADLRQIETAATRSRELVQHLLAFARRQIATPRLIDLNDAVEGMLEMLRRLIGEEIALQWRPGRDLWPVRVDPGQVHQILANLCVNARDAIERTGTVTLETENVAIDQAACAGRPEFVPGPFVRLAVTDDGCGMDETTLGHLFEPFYTTKEIGRGTGLGLATVYGIVRQNQGFVDVRSRPGGGTTLAVYLPRQEGHAGAGSDGTQAAGAAPGRGETVLLAEDEPQILDMARSMLEELGYRVLAAGTPCEAERLAQRHAGSIRLLVTDVVMPDMSGPELAGRLDRLCRGLRHLFISGYTADVIARRGILEQGVHFLQKPFSLTDLSAAVRAALDTEHPEETGP